MAKIDFKKTANPREQLLSFLVLMAICLVFFRVLYFPKRDTIDILKEQVQNLQLEKQSLEKFREALLKIAPSEPVKEYRSPKIEILKGALHPIAEETSLLLSQITTPQFSSGISIRAMSDLPPKKETGYSKGSFFLTAQGSFRNITHYIERVEQLPALLTMDNISLNALDTKASQIELELSGTIYKMEAKSANR